MTMFDGVIPAWCQEVSAGGARQRRVDGHPLAIFFGANEVSKPIFFLIDEAEPKFPRLADTISIDKGRREDGRWTVVLTLEDNALTEAFMGMCVELARRSAAGNSVPAARTIFFETLHDWKALLAGTVPHRMSDQQVRGLLAELWFGMKRLGAVHEITSVVLAWKGPYGAPQDFQTEDGAMYEVKSVHSGSRTVEISSSDQLDPTSDGSLLLCLVGVDEAPASSAHSYSLQSIVEEFKGELNGDAILLEEFEHRLDALQFDSTDKHYGEHFYTVTGCREYEVSGDFPRILRENVPLAVDRLNYRLRIAGLDGFERLDGAKP